MKAPDILKQAAKHIEDRAAKRDKPDGERSMGKTVAAFNAVTGNNLSERDGWVFMQMVKLARACTTPSGSPDDYEDAAAFSALAGEAASINVTSTGEIIGGPFGPIGPFGPTNPCPDKDCSICHAR